ncbi:L,D-transpeptidase [Streptomyces albipurpureus]|uniref:L,D-transpeptidase n=1 Tax=Streptomyces albipurpureus TaxID=2897419 RepID=A0ABT0V0W8_9ACTN|nr:L,D-transpeptidase [Streptomyces sp. CWNU-1]MCM2394146.1 L,D-transpeptidase [Streptomyces sp. CWNU-1]
MARSSSGLVAGLTAAALTAVCFLAYQASASAPASTGKPRTPNAPAITKSPQEKRKDPLALPLTSGTGLRVVYALKERRVWLVDAGSKVNKTFPVMPSTVNPPPGSYTVTSRSGQVAGSDGVAIEHVVRFASVGDISIGFSAAVDGTMATPNPSKKTGGVRMKRADGDAMWRFATIGTKVVVVP